MKDYFQCVVFISAAVAHPPSEQQTPHSKRLNDFQDRVNECHKAVTICAVKALHAFSTVKSLCFNEAMSSFPTKQTTQKDLIYKGFKEFGLLGKFGTGPDTMLVNPIATMMILQT